MKTWIVLCCLLAATTLNAQNTLPQYTGTFNKKELQHLLRRTLFGATHDDLSYFQGKTMNQVVDELLNVPTLAPESPLWHLKNNYGDSASFRVGKTWIGTPGEKAWTNSIVQNSVAYWWHGLMLQQDRNIREKMVLFYDNFLPSNRGQNLQGDGLYYYNRVKLLREHAVGNYKNLVKKATFDPYMMFYLGLNQSTAYNWYDWYSTRTLTPINPNENFARELQELYTVGKGKNNNQQLFTEADVKAAAHVLTGWFVCNNNDGGLRNTYCGGALTYNVEYQPALHSPIDKQFSPLYNNKIITYRSGNNGGELEANEFFDMLFARQETAENIVRKLYRYFVYAYISDNTETQVIQPLARLFRDSNYELKPVLKALFSSEHFYNAEQVGVMIKNPYDYAAGLMRMMGVKYPDTTQLTAGGDLKLYINSYSILGSYANRCGMQISATPDVAGYAAYHQAPLYHHHWINADLLRKRKDIIFNEAGGIWTGLLTMSDYLEDFTIRKDPLMLSLAQKFANPSDATAFVQQNIDYFLVQDLNTNEKNKLKAILENTKGSQNVTISWQNAWNGYQANPASGYLNVYFKLIRFYQELFSYAEFQLM